MKRRELETAHRTAGRVARETEFFLIGSQAVHAYCRRPLAEVLLSQERMPSGAAAFAQRVLLCEALVLRTALSANLHGRGAVAYGTHLL